MKKRLIIGFVVVLVVFSILGCTQQVPESQTQNTPEISNDVNELEGNIAQVDELDSDAELKELETLDQDLEDL